MKLHTRFSTIVFALSVGIGLSTPARAQAPDPCTVYLCMAGMSGSGTTGGPGCAGAVATFFSIQVWSPWFNGPATAMARQTYLMSCPGATTGTNAAIMSAIISQWGQVP